MFVRPSAGAQGLSGGGSFWVGWVTLTAVSTQFHRLHGPATPWGPPPSTWSPTPGASVAGCLRGAGPPNPIPHRFPCTVQGRRFEWPSLLWPIGCQLVLSPSLNARILVGDAAHQTPQKVHPPFNQVPLPCANAGDHTWNGTSWDAACCGAWCHPMGWPWAGCGNWRGGAEGVNSLTVTCPKP